MVKINEYGEKTPVNAEEFLTFSKDYPQITKLLDNNKENLIKMANEITDDDIKNCDSWEKIAKKLLNQLWKVKDAEWFHKPVDPVELNIPDYFNIIKHPMDFSTIKKKLNNYTYTNLKEFCDDMNLVFNNCYTYNGRNTLIGEICTRIKGEYEKLFKEFKLEKFL